MAAMSTALSKAVVQMVAEQHDVGWVPCATEEVDLHAGITETSLMLHLRPESVRLELAEAGDTRPLAEIMPLLMAGGVGAVSPNGVLGDPTGARRDRRRAAEMTADAVRAFADGLMLAACSRGRDRDARMSRVALVTGAARGIGAETVRTLCRDGYGVVAVDSARGERRADGVAYPLATRGELDAVAAEFPDQVLARVATYATAKRWLPQPPMRSPVRVARRRGRGRRGHRRRAAAVGDAGLAPATPMGRRRRGVWNTAAVTVPASCSPGPTPRGGRFVAIASAAGSHGLFHLAAYNAAKHAVVGLVKGLAADLVGTGVTACAVSPGSTRTRMLDATAALVRARRCRRVRRVAAACAALLEPSEIAATIALCCSVEGAALNGSVVSADGGFGQ